MPRYLEEYRVGHIERFGSYEVTREEVIEFASRYDPQPFHLDDEAASANPIFGRVAASGWHTAAMTMRMLVDHNKDNEVTTAGSPGIDELRWLRPVYPGDTLRAESEVLDVRPLKSRAGLGAVKSRTTVFNQHGETVMTQLAAVFIPMRPED